MNDSSGINMLKSFIKNDVSLSLEKKESYYKICDEKIIQNFKDVPDYFIDYIKLVEIKLRDDLLKSETKGDEDIFKERLVDIAMFMMLVMQCERKNIVLKKISEQLGKF